MPPVDGTTPYRNVLSAAQNRIVATICQIRSSIPHAGETGALVEQSFRYHIEEVMPEKVGVSHGFVVDADGRISKQMDIVLYDRLNCPRIFSSAGAQMFPVEATFACGEIKTNLSASKFEESLEKCLSYKKPVPPSLCGTEEYSQYHLHSFWPCLPTLAVDVFRHRS